MRTQTSGRSRKSKGSKSIGKARRALLNKRLAGYSKTVSAVAAAAAGTSGFMMATPVEATLLVGLPDAGTFVGANDTLYLSNTAGSDYFAKIVVGSASTVVFSVQGGDGRGFLGTAQALDLFEPSQEVKIRADYYPYRVIPALGIVKFSNGTNDLPTAGIVGFRTASSPDAVTGLLDFTIDFSELTVTVNNFWYDANASIDVDDDGFSAAHIDPPVDPSVDPPAVPEPATFGLGLLALGAVGVAALKRRREAEAAA